MRRGEPDYPAGLLDLQDPPAILFVRGMLVRGGTAVIGTRTASAAGIAMARDIVPLVAAPLVAGLAHGIDAAVHRAALDAGRTTIAYVGNGLGATYPPDHAELEEAIVASGGAVATERQAGDRATRWSLMRRDRLQAAHARAVVLVETDAAGGAMHTMRFAARLGRPRFAFEPRAGAATDGNALAIAEGAIALPWHAEDAARIIAALRRSSATGSSQSPV